MFPYFIIFGKTIGMYALMAFVGAASVSLVLFALSKKGYDIDLDNTILLALFIAVGIVLGGSLVYALTNVKYFELFLKVRSLNDFFTVFTYIFGGLVYYGGLIGACCFGLIGAKILKLDLKLYADIMAFSVPLFHGFARIGCFLGGCCYGIESEIGFIVWDNALVPELNGVRRFPVQLLESGCNFIIFACILMLFLKFRGKERIKGRLFFIYLGIYSCTRFFLEFLRGDLVRGFVFGMSTSQFISIIMLVISFGGLLAKRGKKSINR